MLFKKKKKHSHGKRSLRWSLLASSQREHFCCHTIILPSYSNNHPRWLAVKSRTSLTFCPRDEEISLAFASPHAQLHFDGWKIPRKNFQQKKKKKNPCKKGHGGVQIYVLCWVFEKDPPRETKSVDYVKWNEK